MALSTGYFVFFHLPRTGGTWVREAIRLQGHKTFEIGDPHGWHSATIPLPRNTYSFTMLRDPFDWLVSWYRLLATHPKWSGPQHPLLMFSGCRLNDFDTFVADYLSYCAGQITKIYAAYTQGVDYIGCMENLSQSFCRAMKSFGSCFEVDQSKLPEKRMSSTRGSGRETIVCNEKHRHSIYESEPELKEYLKDAH